MPTLWSDSNPFQINSFLRLIFPLSSLSLWHALFWLHKMKSETSSWGRKGFCVQHKALQLQSGSVCPWTCLHLHHVPLPEGSRSTRQEAAHQRSQSSKEKHPSYPDPSCSWRTCIWLSLPPWRFRCCSAVQKQRHLLQPEWQQWEEAEAGLSQLSAGWDRLGSEGSEVHSCYLDVLGKELQAELRAQGPIMTWCWHPVVRKAGSARSDQSNR